MVDDAGGVCHRSAGLDAEADIGAQIQRAQAAIERRANRSRLDRVLERRRPRARLAAAATHAGTARSRPAAPTAPAAPATTRAAGPRRLRRVTRTARLISAQQQAPSGSGRPSVSIRSVRSRASLQPSRRVAMPPDRSHAFRSSVEMMVSPAAEAGRAVPCRTTVNREPLTPVRRPARSRSVRGR